MSLKSELLIYQAALDAFDDRQYSSALSEFAKIAETSKVQWNMGMILAQMGRHNEAIARFTESVSMDQYLVAGWFSRGVSYFMVGLYDKAVKDFDMALTYMRGNQDINYTQLGLAHTVYSAEVLHNLGLTRLYLGQSSAGMQDLWKAQKEKVLSGHAVIDECVRDHGRGHSVIVIPPGLLFRPSESKLKNLKARDYMGKAILVAASDPQDAYTTFTGLTRLQRGQTPTGAPLDASHPLGRSATVSGHTRTPTADLPIASRMAKRSQTVRIAPTSNSTSPQPSPGLTRSLTISNPDPSPPISPARHARSRTVDSPSLYSSPSVVAPPIIRPTRPRIVIPATDMAPAGLMQNDRYPAFPAPLDRARLHPASAEVLQTPEEYPTALDDIYDEYRSPTPELEPDMPDLPYTAIGRSFTSPMSAKSASPSQAPSSYRPPPSLATGQSTRSPSNLSRSASNAGRNPGLQLVVEDADSPDSSSQQLAKIRIKVRYGGQTRGMSILPNDTFADLTRDLRAKFPDLGSSMDIRFKDEEGDMMSMQDEGDFEAALDVVSIGRPEGKLEIWID